ncbi:molybdenum cofactor synthesis domain-containing protein [Oceanicella actignis]|uniref:Molybdenum cofactor synthesis domain-containing protein n=2 Tax=Oceanicella actignis TaxID=1189325 RepID=A0A1M7RVU3_9RHOB|nr:molybdenum cofactor synthesis domain-containing protein [Oceanicella actignis]SHN50228.1 molybdenum cofactor synthesis domain-containing protein [Oceanicella actignis]
MTADHAPEHVPDPAAGDGAPSPARVPTAAMIVIGDEILSGRTRDSNMHHLARELTAMGVALREARVVPDERAAIVAAVNALRAAHDHVFTSGGIGPTHDDVTADAVAEAFGVPIDVREDARAILEAYYGDSGALNAARLRMARIPEGAVLIPNPISQAPGFQIGNVYVMAGVPDIFAAMLEEVKPRIVGGPPVLSHALRAPLAEGDIADALAEAARAHPQVSIGSYPFYRGGLGTTLVARARDRAALEAAVRDLREMCARLGAARIEETPPPEGA